jgi:hypothetical protein
MPTTVTLRIKQISFFFFFFNNTGFVGLKQEFPAASLKTFQMAGGPQSQSHWLGGMRGDGEAFHMNLLLHQKKRKDKPTP